MNPSALTSIVSVQHVTQRFGAQAALNDVTFDIPEGHIVGLLGVNGAGKSTLLHTIAGLIVPTHGQCTTLGCDSARLDAPQLQQLGLVMQEGRFIEWMTARQHVEYTASFYPRWDVDLQQRLIHLLNVPMKRKLAELSPGDRQKVSILLGVCFRPALLLLDEPMSSLDPLARGAMLDLLIERVRDDGGSIVISSHLLTDVEKVADWLVVLDRGCLVECGAFDALQESFAEWIVTAPSDRLLPEFDGPCFLSRKVSGRVARVVVRSADSDLPQAFERTHGVEVRMRRLSLEEIFPQLVGKKEVA